MHYFDLKTFTPPNVITALDDAWRHLNWYVLKISKTQIFSFFFCSDSGAINHDVEQKS